ncbi:MAG: purine-nucleoside phosphorylase [Fidelibacterota bacterium]
MADSPVMISPKVHPGSLPSDLEGYVRERVALTPRTAVILGSGLGPFSGRVKKESVIPYEDIPHYPTSGVEGHPGELVAGWMGQEPVVVASGRFHWYEGYDMDAITLPVRLFHALGVTNLIITNAAGSVCLEFPPGTLMALSGHIDFTFRESADLPGIARDDRYHSRALLAAAKRVARREGIDLKTGVYAWTLGPSFETPAEIETIRELGGDAVGMSTVPEIRAAGDLGLRVLGISCLTNYGAGISDRPLTHEEVMESTGKASGAFSRLLEGIIGEIGK